MKKRLLAMSMILVMLSCLVLNVSAAEIEGTRYCGEINGEVVQLHAKYNIDTQKYTTSEEQAALQMREQIKQHQSVATIYVKSFDEDLYGLFDRIWKKAFEETENPAEGDYLYWQMQTMSASYDSILRRENGSYSYYTTFTVKVTYYTTLQQEEELTQRIEQINQQFAFSMETTEYEKVQRIYDYICENVVYDYESDSLKFSAYAAVVNGKSVCQGFATLFYRLAKMQGISSRVIAGHGMDSNVYHGWNIVRIGEFYYNVDATWDSANYHHGRAYEYFLKGDVFVDHTRDAEFATSQFYAIYPMAADAYIPGQIAVASADTVNSQFQMSRSVIRKVTKKKITIQKVGNATGYEIQYATNKKFTKGKKKVRTEKWTYQLKKLKKKKTYYFRARAYRDAGTGRIYTQWSKAKKLKVK